MTETVTQPQGNDPELKDAPPSELQPEEPKQPKAKAKQQKKDIPQARHREGCPRDPVRQETYEARGPAGPRGERGPLWQIVRCQDCGGQRKNLLQEAETHGGDNDYE